MKPFTERASAPWMVQVAIVILLSGCSSNPITAVPVQNPNPEPRVEQCSSTHHCLGFSILEVDREQKSARMIPLRSGDWHFNVTGILNTTFGVSAAVVPSESDPAAGLFAIDVTLTHPFPAKPQFAGFDVRGILITPGSLNVWAVRFADADETRLENADGYTRWWNPSEFVTPGMFGYTQGLLAKTPAGQLTATVNPYKLFADRLGPEDGLEVVKDEPLDSPEGRAVFKAGETNTRRYMIRFPMNPAPVVKYGYAIDASWAAPVPNPPGEVPDNFPIQANSVEPWGVIMKPTVNTLYYDSEYYSGGGMLRLKIMVFDWQGQLNGNVAGQVGSVRVYAPALYTGYADATLVGQYPKFAVYETTLWTNWMPTQPGKILVACQVIAAEGITYQQTAAPAPPEPISAWSAITVNVIDPACSADTDNDWSHATPIDMGTYTMAGQVCSPDDPKDYFSFTAGPGQEPWGTITLYCNSNPDFPSPPRLSLYDSSHNLLLASDVMYGMATLILEKHEQMPGTYYVTVDTTSSDQVVPYVLDSTVDVLNVLPSSPVELTNPELYVASYSCFLHNNHVFLHGLGTWVYDITDPHNPARVFANESWRGWLACFHYPYMYFQVIDETNLVIDMVDFSNPEVPILHEDVINTSAQPAIQMEMDSQYLYIYTGQLKVHVYDYASNPVSPSFVTSFVIPDHTYAMEVMNSDGPDKMLALATVSGASCSLYVYDIDSLPAISLVGSMPITGIFIADLESRENILYTAKIVSPSDGQLEIYEVDPTMPGLVFAGSVDTPGHCRALSEQWPYLYVAEGQIGGSIVDISIPSNPLVVSSFPVPNGCTDVLAAGWQLLASPTSGGFYLFNIQSKESPQYMSHLRTVNYPSGLYCKDEYLIVSSANQAETSYKVLDVENPAEASLACEYYSVTVANSNLEGNILCGAFWDRIAIYNVSMPLYPQLLLAWNTSPSWVSWVTARDDTAYYGNSIPHLVTTDISDPAHPATTSTLPLPDMIYDIRFSSSHLFALHGGGMNIYSLTDPLHPAFVASYPLTSPPRKLAVRDNCAYILAKDGLEIADISNPAAPFTKAWLPIPCPGSYGLEALAIEGSMAYVGGDQMTPVAVIIHPPDSPSIYGPVYDEPDKPGTYGLEIRDGILYEASRWHGVRIFDLY